MSTSIGISHYEVTLLEEGNGGNFDGDETLAAQQRFRFVDDGIFNENRWSLVGQRRAGAAQTPFNVDVHGDRDFVRGLGPVQGLLLFLAEFRGK